MTIKNAMLFFNTETKDVRIIPHPLKRKSLPAPGDWFDTGAAFSGWEKMSPSAKVCHLFAASIWAATTYGIPIRNFYNALVRIPECRTAIEQWPFK